MEIKIKKEIEETVSIELPAYFKEKNLYGTFDEYIAIFSEEDAMKLLLINTRVSASKGRLAEVMLDYHKLADQSKYERIDETTFFDEWNKAVNSLSLEPKLIEKEENPINTEAINQ